MLLSHSELSYSCQHYTSGTVWYLHHIPVGVRSLMASLLRWNEMSTAPRGLWGLFLESSDASRVLSRCRTPQPLRAHLHILWTLCMWDLYSSMASSSAFASSIPTAYNMPVASLPNSLLSTCLADLYPTVWLLAAVCFSASLPSRTEQISPHLGSVDCPSLCFILSFIYLCANKNHAR